MILQLHFGTFRNVNGKMYETCGKDSGFDIMRGAIDTDALVKIFDRENMRLGGLPKMSRWPGSFSAKKRINPCLDSIIALLY